MNYLLDTCLLSELTKPSPNAGVVTWLRSVSSENLLLSAITIGEIKKGLAKMPDSRRKQDLSTWLQTLLADYSGRILPIDLTVAENWGILQGRAEVAGTPMASLDGLIAATAYTHNLTVVTRNERDFAPAHIPLYNPWTA